MRRCLSPYGCLTPDACAPGRHPPSNFTFRPVHLLVSSIGMSKREVWFSRNEEAEALEYEGRTEEALALYLENAREGCDIPFTHERIASIQRKLGRMKESVLAYDRAIELERRRGPSDRLVRLQEKRSVAADLASRPAEAPSRAGRDPRSSSPRAAGPFPKQSSGCLGRASVFTLVLASAAAFMGIALG